MTLTVSRAAPLAPADLVARYDGRAPRYTSYPTAVQFSDKVDAGVYAGWLGELPLDRPISLYVHIPFCTRLCWFCGCSTRAINRIDPVTAYVERLIEEIGLLEAALPGKLTVDGLHFGGGTPNLLTRDHLNDLFRALRHVFRFTPNARIAAELDPVSLTHEWVTAAAHHGLNRASLGVQNLSPQVQAAVNRKEDFEDVAERLGWLRDVGVESINIDLIVRPAAPDPGQHPGNHRPHRHPAAGADRPVRLRPRPLDEGPSAADRRGGAARPAGSPGAGGRGGGAAGRPGAMSRSAWTTSPCPKTSWPGPRPRAGCGATSRAIRPTRPRPCWGSGPRRSARCRRASCRTPCRNWPGRPPLAGTSCPWPRAWRSPTTTASGATSSSG